MATDSTVPPRRRFAVALAVARGVLGIALLVYVLRSGGGWDALRSLFSHAGVLLFLNAVPLAGAVVEATRLGVLFRAHRLKLDFGAGFRVVSIGAFFSLWIPGGTGGDVMKLYYLTGSQPGRRVEVATILLVDRAVAMVALFVLILTTLALQPAVTRTPLILSLTWSVVGVLAIVGAGIAVVWSTRVRGSRLYRWAIARLPLGSFLGRAADALFEFRQNKLALLAAAGLSMIGHTLLAITLGVVGSVLIPGAPALTVASLSLLGLVANVLPLTPGGLGVGEAAADALFRAVGFVGGAGMVTAWRAGTVLVSLLGVLFYTQGIGGTPLVSMQAAPADRHARD